MVRTHMTAAAAADGPYVNLLLKDIAQLDGVPLTLRYQLTGQHERLQRRQPLRLRLPLFGQPLVADVLYGRNGSCIFFRMHLGMLPYSAQDLAERQKVLALLHELQRDADYLNGDLTLLQHPSTGAIIIRSSAVMDGHPDLSDLLNQLVAFAAQVRPYLQVLQPLLRPL